MAKIKTVGIWGLEESIVGSKFPMSVDVESLTDKITPTVNSLASSSKSEGHDQFLDGITVMFDMTFSNKAWVEAERYTFLNFVSSQSTMHRIARMDIRKSCNEYVTENSIKETERLMNIYNEDPTLYNYLVLLYNIPSGFELTARMVTNYRCLKNMYSQRRNHRLPDWKEFCDWCETLPLFREWFVEKSQNA